MDSQKHKFIACFLFAFLFVQSEPLFATGKLISLPCGESFEGEAAITSESEFPLTEQAYREKSVRKDFWIVGDLIQKVLSRLQFKANRKSLKFDVSTWDAKIHADKNKVRAILLDVLSSAIEAAPMGATVFIKAKAEKIRRPNLNPEILIVLDFYVDNWSPKKPPFSEIERTDFNSSLTKTSTHEQFTLSFPWPTPENLETL